MSSRGFNARTQPGDTHCGEIWHYVAVYFTISGFLFEQFYRDDIFINRLYLKIEINVNIISTLHSVVRKDRAHLT